MKCKICQSQAKLALPELEGFKAGKFYDIYECQNCKVSFCYPGESDLDLYKGIYIHSEFIAGYNRYYAYYDAIKYQKCPSDFLAEREDCYWFIINYLKENISKNKAKLLEVGSGLGYLTFSLHKSGYDIQGVELSSDAVSNAKSRFGNLYKCKNALELKSDNERFDVIILTEVIEHISDPVSFINQLSGLLSRNGVILVTTPNKDFPMNSCSEWASDLPPVHLWWFGKRGIKEISLKANLNVKFYSFRIWNLWNFPKYLLKVPKKITYFPRMSRDGLPINPGRVTLKQKGLFKKVKSLFRYWLYSKNNSSDEGGIIGAIFYK